MSEAKIKLRIPPVEKVEYKGFIIEGPIKPQDMNVFIYNILDEDEEVIDGGFFSLTIAKGIIDERYTDN